MITKKTSSWMLLSILAFTFLQSCKKDEEKLAPTINSFEIGENNSGSATQGEYLLINADLNAEAKVEFISIDIYPEVAATNNEDWKYHKVYSEYKGETNVLFTDSILIDRNANSGKYIVKLIVSDLNVNSALETEKFDLLERQAEFNTITDFVIKDNIKYINTDQGLFTLNETNGDYEKVENSFLPSVINAIAVSPATVDNDFWLGSDEGAYNYTTETVFNEDNSGLHNNKVTNFSFDYHSRVFFGTPAGVSIMDGDNWVLNPGKDDQFLEYDITGMGTATNNYTYVATNGMGVERFKYDVDGISGATIFESDWTPLETNVVNCVYVFDTVQLYGTPEGAAIHYSHLTKWDWETFSTNDGLIDNNVISAVKDANGLIWFGTNKGLSSLNNETWTSYSQESNGILSNNINHLAAGSDGSVWFANNDGLCRFMNDEWTNFPK